MFVPGRMLCLYQVGYYVCTREDFMLYHVDTMFVPGRILCLYQEGHCLFARLDTMFILGRIPCFY